MKSGREAWRKMIIEEITAAIKSRTRLYFYEARGGVNQAVECIPVAMAHEPGFILVGVFIPNGARTAIVEGYLLGVNALAAHKAMGRRNVVFSRLSAEAWKFLADAEPAPAPTMDPKEREKMN